MSLVIPSIDLIGGKAVRLVQGKQGTERELGEPLELASKYARTGFGMLHIVDLDAAFGRQNQLSLLPALLSASGKMKIQWAGGIRTFGLAERALDSGAARVVFSTALFASRQEVERPVAQFGSEKVWVSLDFSGKPPIARVNGWTKSTGMELAKAIAAAQDAKVGGIILSSVDKDGMGQGPDVSLVKKARTLTTLPLWLAGGMRSISDARAAFAAGAKGAIFGSALYKEGIDLEELACLQEG